MPDCGYTQFHRTVRRAVAGGRWNPDLSHFVQRVRNTRDRADLLAQLRRRSPRHAGLPRFLRAVHQLRQAGLAPPEQLGQILSAWSEEIVAMWRFTRNNGITEGFHNKMELINRQAYGFRNFEDYRLRVKVLCS